MKRTNTKALLGLTVLASLVVWGSAACNSGRTAARAPQEMLSRDLLIPILGEAKDSSSGLADFTQSDRELILSYHLYLADRSNPDLEIARDLAPKIRKLYGHLKDVDRVSFGVSLPSLSASDDWAPYVSFVMTRKLVKETGWSDLLDTDLLSVALEVKRTQ